MPVEIKELVIRATAKEDDRIPVKTRERHEPRDDYAFVAKACVREVLRILRKSKER